MQSTVNQRRLFTVAAASGRRSFVSRNRRPETATATALFGVDARQRPPYQIDEQRSACGFTLLELMFVMAIILILASFALPTYTTIMQRAREAVLRQDLQTMRQLIDEYTIDKQQPPQELQDLVDAGYLRGGIPADPMTGSNDSWKVDVEQVPTAPDASSTGIVDVHSGSDATSLAGTPYAEW